MERFDIAVIGTGPAGEGAAMMAAKNHKRVAVIERHFEVGGGCTHWGTIPSKALRHAVRQFHDLRSNPMLKEYRRNLQLGFPQLLGAADSAVASQVAQRRRYYERNKIALIEGEARFTDPHQIEVQRPSGQPLKLRADHVVIAAGSRPYHPPELDFTHPRIRDSDSILKYGETPFAITIYGAGVIGCEYASIFLNLGCKVTLVNTQDRLLSFLDDEITEALSYHLREQGCIIRHNESFAGVDARDRDVVLNLKSGRKIKSDVLLWANGRTGNSDALALDKAGIVANARGQIEVNASFQTSVPHIYAGGDIIGPPALASVAYDQGRYAVEHILTGKADPDRATLAPTGIYTLPEISSVGRNERELQEAHVPYDVGHASFKSLARAQMTGETTGMLKILFHAETLAILGVHCFGDRASEIVHIGQTVMASKDLNSLRYFINTTFNYPTMAEAYRVAAHNGLNRLA
ncbi:MAG TPA: Si-specific NAD(P)(+) transhydrogenase [Verrucomicrobiae bacterium]|nr:Si-specific NAD(P)(+) transhydrogenase [Verrucomicrobiae bacterium]